MLYGCGAFTCWVGQVAIPTTRNTAAAPPGFQCPESMICRPKRAPDSARAWVGYLHHLHSGEEFGPAGTVISILSGFALIFFSLSGLWLYVQMWRNRKERAQHPRWFWK